MKKIDYSDLWSDVKLKDILKPDLLRKYREAGIQTTGDIITYSAAFYPKRGYAAVKLSVGKHQVHPLSQ